MRSALLASFALTAGVAVASCLGNEAHDTPGDPPADAGPPSALGNGARIEAVVTQYSKPDSGAPVGSTNAGPTVNITGSSLIAVDNFDETHDGKSLGYLYVEDLPKEGAVPAAYSGIELYKPTFTPANLLVGPGDVLDFTGTYTNYAYSGFTKGLFYPEMDEPDVTFRFEYSPPAPAVISLDDLGTMVATNPAMFSQGLRWLSMLVEVDNVTVVSTNTYKDRVSLYLTSDSTNGPAVSNELFDVLPTDYPTGTKFSKVIGIATFFFSFHIAPRSPADLIVAK
jgi:hypothetical protein